MHEERETETERGRRRENGIANLQCPSDRNVGHCLELSRGRLARSAGAPGPDSRRVGPRLRPPRARMLFSVSVVICSGPPPPRERRKLAIGWELCLGATKHVVQVFG